MPVPDPVRIAFVSSHAQLGGSERVLEDLLRGVPRQCVASVIVLQRGPLLDRLTDVPIRVVETGNGAGAIARSALAIRGHLRRVDADVVHANGVKAATVAALAGRPARPLVWMRHDFSFEGRLARFIARRCAVVVGVSTAVLAGVREVATTEVVRPGVRVAALDRRQARARLGLASDGPVVGMVGRIHPAKGHADVIDLMPELAGRVPEVRLIVVGGEDAASRGFAEDLAERARSLGPLVEFIGHRDDAPDLVRAFDVVVVPSRASGQGSSEGFGLAAAEAVAAGVPVVVTDVGALPEVVGDAGWVVPAGDRRALVEALHAALTTRRPNARPTTTSVGDMVERMLAVYRRVARSSGSA